MIEFTIKTLDGKDHNFSVDDETTIEDVKLLVQQRLGLEPRLQRLIFCGRVLQDDRRLDEIEIHGKVMHLVQRPPPGPGERQVAGAPTPRPSTSGASAPVDPGASPQDILRRLMHQRQLALSPTANRLEFIKTLIGDIRLMLFNLREFMEQNGVPRVVRRMPLPELVPEIPLVLQPMMPPVEPMEVELGGDEPLGGNDLPAGEEDDGMMPQDESMDNGGEQPAAATPPDGESAANAAPAAGPSTSSEPAQDPSTSDGFSEEMIDPVRRAEIMRRRALRSARGRRHSPRDLSRLLEELEMLFMRFTPHRIMYINLLDAEYRGNPPRYNETERRAYQRIVDMVGDIMHSFSHAYHAVSDITFQVAQRIPRLSSDIVIPRNPIPVQAHINVVHTTSRRAAPAPSVTSEEVAGAESETPPSEESMSVPQSSDSGESSVPPSEGSGASFAPATPSSPPPSSSGGSPAPSPSPSANPTAPAPATQPTVNISIQPSNAEGGRTTYQVEIGTRMPIPITVETSVFNNVSVLMGDHQQQEQQQQGQPQQAPAQQGQDPHQGQGQRGSDDQGQRRQIAFAELESLFRGAQPAGVELVVSMEESGGEPAAPAPAAPGAANHAGDGQPLVGAEIYLAQVPLPSGPPPVDLLHNIVSAVVRHGLGAPGLAAVPGLALSGILPMRPDGTSSASNPGSDLNNQSNANRVPESPRQAAEGAEQDPRGAQTQAQAQAAQGVPGDNQRFVMPSVQVRRIASAARDPPVPGDAYDRFLPCDNAHARSGLQRRREEHQRDAEILMRMRNDREAARDFAYVRERGSELYEDDMALVERLLGSPPSVEAWMCAYLCCAARHVHCAEMLQPLGPAPPVAPAELPAARALLRALVRRLLELTRRDDWRTAHTAIADYLVARNGDFIARFPQLAVVREGVDVAASLRSLLRARLPALLATLMLDVQSELYAATLCSLAAALFKDLLSLVLRCCMDAGNGMRLIFHVFVEDITENEEDEEIGDFLRRFFLDVYAKVRHSLYDNTRSISLHVVHYQESALRRRRNLIAQREMAPEPLTTRSQSVAPPAPLARPVARRARLADAETMTDPIVICSASPSSPPVTAGIFRSSVVHGAFGVHGQHCAQQQNQLQQPPQPHHSQQHQQRQQEQRSQQPQQQQPEQEQPHQQQAQQLPQQFPIQQQQRPPMAQHRPQLQPLRNQNPAHRPHLHNHQLQHLPDEPPPPQPMGQGPNNDDAVRFNHVLNNQAGVHNRVPFHNLGPFQGLAQVRGALNPGPRAPRTPPPGPPAAPRPAPPRTARPAKTESPSRSAPESPTNVRLVPPVLIVEHWGEEWVPVFAEDQAVQRGGQPQPPYSDAYLSGMPSRKRRCLRQARPPATLGELLRESCGEAHAGEASGAESEAEAEVGPEEVALAAAFREHVRGLTRARAARSPDFEPTRYAATAHFLAPSNTEQPSEGAE